MKEVILKAPKGEFRYSKFRNILKGYLEARYSHFKPDRIEVVCEDIMMRCMEAFYRSGGKQDYFVPKWAVCHYFKSKQSFDMVRQTMKVERLDEEKIGLASAWDINPAKYVELKVEAEQYNEYPRYGGSRYWDLKNKKMITNKVFRERLAR